MLFVFIYVYWCPTRFQYQMMFVSFYSNTTGVIKWSRNCLFVWWCLAPLSTMLHLYRGGQLYWWRTRRKPPTCPTPPQHLSSPPVFSRVCVAWSLVFCVMFFCPLSFDHCIVRPFLIYSFWLPLWYLQTFGHCFVCHFWFTASGYPVGIFKLFLVFRPGWP